MKNRTRLLILSAPFLFMVFINEISRAVIEEEAYKRYGVESINPAMRVENRCSWVCHNSTSYCATHHIKYLHSVKSKIDPLYFGIIAFLNSFGNYALANIFFLIVLWPLLMWFLLVKCIELHRTSKEI